MQNIIKYIFLSAIVIGTNSCEEIVTLDLKKIEPRIVIDASITENQECFVSITKTQNFNDSFPSESVNGASITISDSNGRTESFKESRQYAGLYMASVTGVVGVEYTLDVVLDGQKYTAKATIPPVVPIDSIYIYNIQPGKDPWYSPCIVYRDPPGKGNYYHSLVYVNGNLMRTIHLSKDEFNDGLVVDDILYFNEEHNNDEELKIGDHIMVEFQSLDVGAYTFYNSIAFSSGTNPISNFSGGVLGCFKAYNTDIKEVVIEENIIYTPPK